MTNNSSKISRLLKTSIVFISLFLTFCQTGRNSSSANVFRLYSLAIEQYHQKNYEFALDYINEAIAVNNKIAGQFELKGDIFLALGEGNKALREYQAAKELRFSPAILIKIGSAHYRLNELSLAVKNFKTAYAQKPEQAETLLLLVDCFIQQREYELSLNQLGDYKKQCEKLKKTLSPQYYILLGKVYFEKGMFKDCVNAVASATEIKGRNECIFYLKALFEVKQYEMAYDLLGELNPILDNSDVHYFRGLYYYSVENYTVAKTQLDLSVGYKTQLADAYILLAELYKKDGDITRATELLTIAKPLENQRLINIGL